MPYVALILYYRKSWLEIKLFKIDANQPVFSTSISIIIPARNEEKNISNCLESIANQTYPKELYEVIVIDDHSSDSTAEIVTTFSGKNIRLIKLEDFTDNSILNSYKKKAVETGIGQAKGNLVITTDADCIALPSWLEIIASYYEKTKAVFIVAPVMFIDPAAGLSFQKKFFAIFQSLDFMMLQGITGASVFKKIHNMCNGANLAYEKKVFYEVGGFEGIDNIASGDDMLLMHKIQERYPQKIAYLKSNEAIIQTKPAATLQEFFHQRIRWASKADKYPDYKIISVLALVYLFNGWIFLLGILSFLSRQAFYLFLFLLFVKIIAELYFITTIASFFKRKKMLWWFVPSQPFHIIYTLIAGWLGKFGTYTWKGRKVK